MPPTMPSTMQSAAPAAPRRAFDPSVYLVTDHQLCGEKGLVDVVGLAVRGGATLVQLREKRLSTRELVDMGRALMGLLEPFGVPLIINDRVDAALAVGAHGVHLGQIDMPAELARHLLGPEAIIGLSLEHMGQLREAERYDIDYYGVSPVFPTPTKPEAGPGWGIEGLSGLRAATDRPLVAIGGIDAGNAAQVIRAGADGVAVVSAICAAADPLKACEDLHAAVLEGRNGRQ